MDVIKDSYATILLFMVGVLGWFMRDMKSAFDKKHEQHSIHAADMELHETPQMRESIRQSYRNDRNEVSAELIRHTAQDDKRFERIEMKIDIAHEDIKNILRAVAKIP